MMSVRQMADAVAVRQFKQDGLRAIDAEYRGQFLYLYFLGPASGENVPMPKYFQTHWMELDCGDEENAHRNMEKLLGPSPDFSA